MNLSFLPNEIKTVLNQVNLTKVCEIRLKINQPITVWYDFKNYYLGKNNITLDKGNAIICTSDMIDGIIYTVTEYSLYAATEKIKDGYLTTVDGIRIGIAGECVVDDGKVITIKNFSSLCIRFPHEIINCSDKLCKSVFNNGLLNLLIISPPRFGKTTLLKDIIRKYENHYNMLVIDERGELVPQRFSNADVIKYSSKEYAFEKAVRSLAPQVVVTDELACENDWKCVKNAVNCGVKIIATAHGDSVDDIKTKKGFEYDLFDKYVVLDTKTIGKIKCVYDKNFNESV